MEIRPDSVVRFYSGIPFDNTYEHTVWFSSITAQNNYFHNGTRHKFEVGNMSYQRVNRGVMRVEIPADDLYDCNYMAFRNTKYSGRWFYAFITAVEYVNDKTASVIYELDDMQTWLFDVELKQCFVDREHSTTDEIGENILPEPVELGEYVTTDFGSISKGNGSFDITRTCVLIAVTLEAQGEGYTSGTTYQGIYGGCELWAFETDNTSGIQDFLESYIQIPDQIIGVYMCPHDLLRHSSFDSAGTKIWKTSDSEVGTFQLNGVQSTDSFQGYIPKNKKLYTYPYNFLRVDNASGQSLNLRYEFFGSGIPRLRIDGTFVQPVSLVLRPFDYKGLPYSQSTPVKQLNVSTSEYITLNEYPVCSWNVDSYKAWLAQNSVPLALKSIATIGGATLTSVATSNPFPAMGAMVNVTADILSARYQASIAPDTCRGDFTNGQVNFTRGLQDFFKMRCHITKDYAEMIDAFFNAYGYSTKKVKVPNRSSRPHWNYVKTSTCVLEGSAPADAIKHLSTIYNNGITFWRYASEVGNYSLNNSPS